MVVDLSVIRLKSRWCQASVFPCTWTTMFLWNLLTTFLWFVRKNVILLYLLPRMLSTETRKRNICSAIIRELGKRNCGWFRRTRFFPSSQFFVFSDEPFINVFSNYLATIKPNMSFSAQHPYFSWVQANVANRTNSSSNIRSNTSHCNKYERSFTVIIDFSFPRGKEHNGLFIVVLAEGARCAPWQNLCRNNPKVLWIKARFSLDLIISPIHEANCYSSAQYSNIFCKIPLLSKEYRCHILEYSSS